MRRKFSRKFVVAVCIFAIIVVLTGWIVWGNTALMTDRITIRSDRVPAAFSGFRIAQISDLHNAEFGEHNAALLQMLSETEPDIIAVTGDLVDSRRTDLDIALNFVQEAIKIAPVYYVTGNHEARIAQYDSLKSSLEAMGVVVLEDASIQLERGGENIQLIGLSDPSFAVNSSLSDGVSDMIGAKLNDLLEEDASYTILLSHRPELFETYTACGVDLVLSGHAHGGQIQLPFIGGLVAPNQGLFPKYDAGLYLDGVTNMVVSRGIGSSIFPLRVNNRPEIVLIELEAE